MLKSKSFSALLLVGLYLSSFSTTFAYWQGNVSSANKNNNILIGIGSWEWSIEENHPDIPLLVKPEQLPLGDQYKNALDDDYPFAYSLEAVTGVNSNVFLNVGTYFTYVDPVTGEKALYRTKNNYNPSYHGLTPTNENVYTRISVNIDYSDIDAYVAGKVVRVIENGVASFYVANWYSLGAYPLDNLSMSDNQRSKWSEITGPNGNVNDVIGNWRAYFKPLVLTDIDGITYTIDFPDFSQVLPWSSDQTKAASFYYVREQNNGRISI